jgi:hypothetical protein
MKVLGPASFGSISDVAPPNKTAILSNDDDEPEREKSRRPKVLLPSELFSGNMAISGQIR